MKRGFWIAYVLLLLAQLLMSNYFHVTPYIFLTILPVMVLCIPIRVGTVGAMFIACASGLVVDFLSEGVLGLNALALIPVAFARHGIIGLIFGSLPFAIPGMPVPVKLGLAGGPLIIAILISRYGYKIHLVTYTTTSANMMLREIGLVLFLASVGIKAGAGFFETVIEGDGLLYVMTGFLITVIPILIIGPIARMRYRFNYFTIAGMIAGTYTDPPALAYANSICSKEAPALGYSTVYPLAMFLRIFTAQIVVLFFCG